MAFDKIDENNWLTAANTLYKNERDLRKNYRRNIDRSPILREKEQEWCYLYFQELADRLTSDDIWRKMIPGLDLYGVNNRQSQRHIQVSEKDQVYYSGSHWISRKCEDAKWFDSHNEYQTRRNNDLLRIFQLRFSIEIISQSDA